MTEGLVLSRSCTTGWFDWNHGELILTSEALIRRRLPAPTAEALRWQNTVPDSPASCSAPGIADAAQVLAADPSNRFIPLHQIESARLHRGLLTDRLSIQLRDGTRYKLLWLHIDPASGLLRQRLPALVPGVLRPD